MRTDWHLLPRRVKSLEMKNIAKMLGSDKYDQLTSSHFLNIRPALKFKTKSAIYTETYISMYVNIFNVILTLSIRCRLLQLSEGFRFHSKHVWYEHRMCLRPPWGCGARISIYTLSLNALWKTFYRCDSASLSSDADHLP